MCLNEKLQNKDKEGGLKYMYMYIYVCTVNNLYSLGLI